MSSFQSDLDARLNAAAALVSEKSLLELLELIWRNDRFFTNPAYNATAQLAAAKMREWNLQSEICNLPADGKTLLGDWKMPLGWDCAGATLEIAEPSSHKGKVLADWKKKPTHIVMWSGPTPPAGITAEVVSIEDYKDLKTRLNEVRGKIVYTPINPRGFKKKLADNGALGVVTSFCRNRELIPDACFWVNGWSDNPGGWAFQAGDAPLPGMLINLHVAKELESLLAAGTVKLTMKVDTRYFEGTLPVVSGYVNAPSDTEVLAIGHAQEQGANDNASGCAVIMESLRVIEDGVRNGKLAPIKRRVRGILTNECYGTIGFAAKNPDVMRRTIMGVNWDSMARCAKGAQANFRHHHCPDASASVADTLMDALLHAWLPKKLPGINMSYALPFALTDNAYCDPLIGVHCTYVDSQDAFWHTSADVLETIEAGTLHAFATISVAFLHYLASAGAAEALSLAQQALEVAARKFEKIAADHAGLLAVLGVDKADVLAEGYDRLDYAVEICAAAILSAERLMTSDEIAREHKKIVALQQNALELAGKQKQQLRQLAGCEPQACKDFHLFDDIAQRRPKKKFIGTPAYDGVPRDKQQEIDSPVWDTALHCALFWADGKHTFADIVRRVSYEHGHAGGPGLADHFRFMAEHGLIEWQ